MISAGTARAAAPRRRRVLLVAAAAAAATLPGCAPGNSEPADERRVQCAAPTTLQVQVTGGAAEDSLTIAAGGIGASPLRSTAPDEEPEAADPGLPLHELPPGQHVRIADLDTGEIVRSEALAGGVARTEPLDEGDYLVGLISVEDPGGIAGLATSELTVDERGSTVSTPSVGASRELPVERLDVEDSTLEAQAAVEEDSPAAVQWWLGGEQDSASGTADEDGALRVDEVDDGEHTLVLAAQSERAPGIVEQAAGCEFTVADGQLQPTAGTSGS